jgi:hypothetical protein
MTPGPRKTVAIDRSRRRSSSPARWRRWLVPGTATVALVAVGFLVLLATSDATRTQLTIVGAALEAVGIGLVALDFWAPAAARGLRWIRSWDVRARLRRLIDWFARRKRHAVFASLTMPWESAGAITAKVTSPRVTSFEEVSARLQKITDRITTIEGENARAHERLGNQMVERRSGCEPRFRSGSPGARISTCPGASSDS